MAGLVGGWMDWWLCKIREKLKLRGRLDHNEANQNIFEDSYELCDLYLGRL